MSKVDWINWKTDKKEIINPEYIYDNISDKLQSNIDIFNVINDTLNTEINRGGLDINSLNIMGEAPAREKAMIILKRLDYIKQSMEQLKNNIYNSSLEQKKEEKEELINEINKKIMEEEKILNNKVNLYEKININNNSINKNDIEDIIEISNERIKNLKEKLNQAKEL